VNKNKKIAYYKAHQEDLNIKKLSCMVDDNAIGKHESIKLICKEGKYKNYNYKRMLVDSYYVCECGCTTYSMFEIKMLIAKRSLNEIFDKVRGDLVTFINK
jgi:hypothetical protein